MAGFLIANGTTAMHADDVNKNKKKRAIQMIIMMI